MNAERIHIVQGEHAVGMGENTVITTLLGSCVACCMWDDATGIGGMNHMLLAAGRAQSTVDALADINEIETLINALTRLGADRSRLKAKAFGGARMVSGLSDIGQQNSDFTLRYLAREGIEVVTQSLGGSHARNIRFWPGSGRVMQRVSSTKVREVETRVPRREGNDLELF
ncbi:chemotaxis protein CheD [uncultured Tateyamaria sp.]|uniref:chemotaxis protein CheD n=1 Tax=Tateyamaria sp. 1078 TaxID=3417464 RepID=UPI00263242C5|nr:chemotaxis protein CheD [uncultured Tateyamaria sp.]